MQEIIDSLGLDSSFEVVGDVCLDSCFAVSDLAASTMGSVGSALAALIQDAGLSNSAPSVRVDQRLASLWFAWSIQPIAWELPPAWDAIAGDYLPQIEVTPWGEAKRLKPALNIDGAAMRWSLPANNLGTSAAWWSTV